MTTQARTAGAPRQELPWLLMVLAVAAHFSLIYEWANVPFLKLADYADGRSMLPYQARVLMAWVLRATVHRGWVNAIARHAPPHLHDPFTVVLTITTFLSIVVAVIATRASVHVLTGDNGYARWASLLVVLMAYFNMVLPYGLSYTLPYDLPSLALFCVGLALVIEQQWWLYYPVFILGTLNRETFCMVTIFALLYGWGQMCELRLSERVRRLLPHVLVQAVIWLAIKLWLHAHFIGNATEGGGGGVLTTPIRTNLHSLLNPGQWPLFASLFGFLWVPLWLGRRHIGNAGIRLAFTGMLPLWTVVMFCVGVIVEVRVFNELAALLAIVAALEAWELWFRRIRTV